MDTNNDKSINLNKYISSSGVCSRREAEKYIKEGDEILITELEHHSNYVPWHFLRKKKGAVIKFAPVNENGEVEIDEIKKLISK